MPHLQVLDTNPDNHNSRIIRVIIRLCPLRLQVPVQVKVRTVDDSIRSTHLMERKQISVGILRRVLVDIDTHLTRLRLGHLALRLSL